MLFDLLFVQKITAKIYLFSPISVDNYTGQLFQVKSPRRISSSFFTKRPEGYEDVVTV